MKVIKSIAILGLALATMDSCKKDETVEVSNPDSIQTQLNKGTTPKELIDCGAPIDSLYGKRYEGGYIFYYDPKLDYGLIAAENDLSNAWANWGCTGIDIKGAEGTEIGTGKQNTAEIVSECSTTGTPAYLCNNLSENGYSDWFLPSKDELNAIYTNLRINEFGGINDLQYWSSSEQDADNVWRQYLGIGNPDWKDGNQYLSTKDLIAVESRIRPVRSF